MSRPPNKNGPTELHAKIVSRYQGSDRSCFVLSATAFPAHQLDGKNELNFIDFVKSGDKLKVVLVMSYDGCCIFSIFSWLSVV